MDGNVGVKGLLTVELESRIGDGVRCPYIPVWERRSDLLARQAAKICGSVRCLCRGRAPPSINGPAANFTNWSLYRCCARHLCS
jgi:hypothetical protein